MAVVGVVTGAVVGGEEEEGGDEVNQVCYLREAARGGNSRRGKERKGKESVLLLLQQYVPEEWQARTPPASRPTPANPDRPGPRAL